MGGFFSKKPDPIQFTPDSSKATIPFTEYQNQIKQFQDQAQLANLQIAQRKSHYKTEAWLFGALLGLGVIVVLGMLIYDGLALAFGWNFTFILHHENEGFTATKEPISKEPEPKPAKKTYPPPLLTRIYNSYFGGSSGDLAPSFHDASTATSIQGNLAPLSAERDGGYGMQWWMYVKDWNYGYGKKKPVLKRSSGTSAGITNPDIYLHPTDNALEVSVSVYPATEGSSGKATPAPAGHSGSSDDVFVCTVPNIPLQTWFSVSVTVFGRNMDIYIDGKLVKSCFLSGVPKPAVGNIDLTPEGGFSGRVCNFYHYPKMLTPSDAMTFWSAGTPCRSQTTSGGSAATGYSVKFGVYDAVGKEVQEYSF